MHRADNYSTENGTYSSSNFHHDQRSEPLESISSTSNPIAANVPQEYNSQTSYPSSDPYGYSNSNYAGYYNGYQQQSNQSYPQPVGSYPQPVGSYQSTGAPHQPLSSFPNSGSSYAAPASYSSTYYNPADYQTTGGGYQGGGYSDQNNSWQGHYPSYNNHQYPNYATESSATYTSSNAAAAATSHQYQQQHYKQWTDYYSQTEVSCAPGTENLSVASTPNPVRPVPGGYSASNTQPPAPFTPSWRPESSSSELPSVQVWVCFSSCMFKFLI